MICDCCGQDFGAISFDTGYQMPDEIWQLSEEEQQQRCQISADLCRLDERYFLRGVAFIPIGNSVESYGWGIWVEVSETDFFSYVAKYADDNSLEPIFTGTVANDISHYGKTRGLKVDVQLGNSSQRPSFVFYPSTHQLVFDQTHGIALEKVHQFNI